MSKQGKKENSWLLNNIQLIIVVAFALIITISLIYINSTSNILGHSYRDVYFYLIQALRFSGLEIGGYEYVYYLSPLIPYLTSILFRFGFVSEISIFIVTGFFYLIAIIGMYYLLNFRFNKNISCIGALFYGSLTINLIWAANGTLDVCSISLSIWSLYFFILAMEKNQKYFYLAFPIAILSFLAKYTGALIFAIFILYFLSKRNIFGNIKRCLKNLIGGMMAGAICIIPFVNYYLANNIPFGFLNQAEEISSKTTAGASAIAKPVENQLFYYFENIPKCIYQPKEAIAYIFVIVGIIGLIYGFYKLCSYIQDYYRKSDEKISLSFFEKIKLKKEIYVFLLILSLISMIMAFLTASKVSFIISEMIFYLSALIFSIAFNSLFADLSRLNLFTNRNKDIKTQERYKYKFFNYDLAMLAWFMGYMIFFSAHLTKTERYFTAFAPGFVFLITFSLDIILKRLDKIFNGKETKSNETSSSNIKSLKTDKLKKDFKTRIPQIVAILFIALLLFNTANFLKMDKHDPLVDDEKDASIWIKENVPNYENTIIWSDRGPIYTWYLKSNIGYFQDTNNITAMEKCLNENNVSYYISWQYAGEINGFEKIKSYDNVNIYKSNKLTK